MVGFRKTCTDSLPSTHLNVRSRNSKPFYWSAISIVNLIFLASSMLLINSKKEGSVSVPCSQETNTLSGNLFQVVGLFFELYGQFADY